MGLLTPVSNAAFRAALLRSAAALPALLLAGPLHAQAPGMPVLRAGEGQQALAIEALDIQVQVVGTLATTTWDITFRNPQGRVLEGELVFPLAEGQTVSRFALPVNGVLREGVVVPKAKGREAFEAVVRRPTQVDPGLLEKTEGNAFRTRIYPIPALGTYRIVLAYEQELKSGGQEGLRYLLPLAFKERVGTFAVHLEVSEQDALPRIRTSFQDLTFERKGRSWKAEYHGRDVRLDRTLDLVLPRDSDRTALFIHREGGLHHFYAQLDLPPHREAKVLPRRLLVVWDASASGAQRDLKRERALLAAYLKAIGHAQVDVAVLRNDVEGPTTFQVREGRSESLMRFLEALPLDGGTRMDALHLARHPADEVLLFSDGLSNLGSGEPQLPKAPLVALNSAVHGHHAWLRGLGEARGGEYLDLQAMKDSEALDALKTQPLAFLGFGGAPGDVHDVLPARGSVIRGTFGLSGVQISEKARLTLRFGYGSRVAFTREIVLDAGEATEHPLARRIWAQKKLAELALDPTRNREEILRLGQAHGIVTDETSLIVLETVEDYARFRIPPPKELRAAYDRLTTGMDQAKRTEREGQIAQLAGRLEELKQWWARDFTGEPLRKVAPLPVVPVPAPLGPGVVEGRVEDQRGAPVAGAQVSVQDEAGHWATVQATDSEGRFRLPRLPLGNAQLIVSRSGLSSVRQSVRIGAKATPLLVKLRPESQAAVEVVGNAVSIDATQVAGGSALNTESLQSLPQGRDLRDVAFLAPGIQGASGTGNAFVVDGLDAKDFRAGFQVGQEVASTQEARASGRVEVVAWSADAPYLKALKEVEASERYAAYLNLRKAYGAAPGFYLDVCDYFDQAKDRAMALRVLSNLAELNLDHPGLLRVLGHRLLQMGEHNLAIQIFERVLRLREEEPQSLRDLALAHAQAGHAQAAADRLYEVAVGRWDPRFADVDLIALEELNALAATRRIETGAYDKRLLAHLPVDIRVVLSWDTNDSDMDLHVTDPSGERCMFSHTRTAQGGRISRDCTQGYGPEEFLLRRALPGTYRIEANYFGTRQQTAVVGPTTLKAVLFMHYGTPQETRKEILLKLDGHGQTVFVGSFDIGK